MFTLTHEIVVAKDLDRFLVEKFFPLNGNAEEFFFYKYNQTLYKKERYPKDAAKFCGQKHSNRTKKETCTMLRRWHSVVIY